LGVISANLDFSRLKDEEFRRKKEKKILKKREEKRQEIREMYYGG